MKKCLITLALTLIVLMLGVASVSAADVGDTIYAGEYVIEAYDFKSFPELYINNVTYTSKGESFTSFYVNSLGSLYYSPGNVLAFDNVTSAWTLGYQIVTLTSDFVIKTEDQAAFFGFFRSTADFSPGGGLAEDLLALFDDAAAWIVSALGRFVALFWIPNNGLTFIGVLCIVTLGIAVFFLLFNILCKFLLFRS